MELKQEWYYAKILQKLGNFGLVSTITHFEISLKVHLCLAVSVELLFINSGLTRLQPYLRKMLNPCFRQKLNFYDEALKINQVGFSFRLIWGPAWLSGKVFDS